MSSETPVRRRVRTGCLTCRGRRRKCDEARPTCNNCRLKELTCRYGINVTFVDPRGHRLSPEIPTSNRTAATAQQTVAQGTPVSTHTTNTSARRNVSQSAQTSRYAHECTSENVVPIRNSLLDVENSSNIELDNSWTTSQTGLQDGNVIQTTENSVVGLVNASAAQSLPWATEHENEGPESIAPFRHEETDEQYELQLLHHYRYQIATILDLELGELNYSVEIMTLAKRSFCIYKALLAAASCHRAATDDSNRDVDEIASTRFLKEAFEEQYTVSSKDAITRMTMALIIIFIEQNPEVWLERVHNLAFDTLKSAITFEAQPLLLRLVLSAIIMTPVSRSNLELRLLQINTLPTELSVLDPNNSQYELQAALILLGQSINILYGTPRSGKHLLDNWQLCWQELGRWYAERSLEMQEILQLSEVTFEERVFPLILFSNACATVANVVYHLATTLLLQSKPRSIKTSARHGSSTSLLWHVQHILGTAKAATDGGFWDPLVIAAVVHAAKQLSHHKQRHAAAQTLRQMAKVSGMRLQNNVDDLIASGGV